MSTEQMLPYETTIHVRDNCLCLHTQRAARSLARRFDQALKPFGLTNGQFSLLMSLNRPQPATMGSVAQVLAMDRTTLTAALKPLERTGLLIVQPNPKDRREKQLVLTALGRERLARALPTWHSTHATIESEKPQCDFDRLRHDLRELGV